MYCARSSIAIYKEKEEETMTEKNQSACPGATVDEPATPLLYGIHFTAMPQLELS